MLRTSSARRNIEAILHASRPRGVAGGAFSLDNWASEMACGAHTAVVAMGEDLEAGGAAPGSKLRSMFTDFECFSSGVVGVGLEAARNGKKVVRSLPRASPPSRGPPRGPGTPTGVSGDLGGGIHNPGEAGRER